MMAANHLPCKYPDSGSSESSDGEDNDESCPISRISLVDSDLDDASFESSLLSGTASGHKITHITATNNRIQCIPPRISTFHCLTRLDLSNNHLDHLPAGISSLTQLSHLYLRNNRLSDGGFPKDLHGLRSLRTLNLSGNNLQLFPPQILHLMSLRNLFLGDNHLTEVDARIGKLRRLRLIYLGGNLLETLPDTIGNLPYLQVLLLSDNRLVRIPCSICDLPRLQCLHLHCNRLTTLPHSLVYMNSLSELSLRGNPLVSNFVRDMANQPSSLLELAGRVIKVKNIQYSEEDLPMSLHRYLTTSGSCVNPACSGVYFHNRVEHVKFSDFCGKYKIPLLQFLCSNSCRTQLPEYADCEVEDNQVDRMRRVLLG